MAHRWRSAAIAANLALAVGLVLVWAALAPTNIGGRASYVIIKGHSMEPRFRAGDLAIVYRAADYQVGDIVTYWNDSLGAYTIHRIIGIDQERFVVKGDNNSWIDPLEPGKTDIIGKLWLHIPRLGSVVEWLRSPLNFAILIGLAGGILMAGMAFGPRREQEGVFAAQTSTGILGVALYLFGLGFFAFLALSFYAFSRPVTVAANNLLYQQEGLFSYSANGTPGIYDRTTVQAGEPIFPRLTCLLNVGYTYNLVGSQVQGLTGSHQLYARVLDEQSGWQRTLPMNQVAPFSGNTFFDTGVVDLCQVEALVRTLEQQTGLRPGTYTLAIVSSVAVTANVAGEPKTDSFVSVLPFKFDEAHFYLANADAAGDILHTSKPSLGDGTTLRDNVLPLLGWEPTVLSARIAAVTGMLLALAGALVVGLQLYSAAKHNQEALIRLKYGYLLVDAFEGAYELHPPVIDVTSMDNLAKLAERHHTLIVHIARDFLHDYMVQAGNATYRFSTSAGAGSAGQPAAGDFLWNTQPQAAERRTPPVYDLEDTRPRPAARREAPNAVCENENAYSDADTSMFIRKSRD